MSELRDKLPAGYWYFIPDLPLETTPESLSAWFAARGLEIPVGHLSLKEYPHCKSCVVCIPRDTVLSLVLWCVGDDKFMGATVAPEMMKGAR